MSIEHAEGKVVTASDTVASELADGGFVAVRYVDEDGRFDTYPANPNGSDAGIAGLCDKTGRIFGHLMGLLTLMKGQPLAYNKDNQEDKEPLFDTVDNLKGSLKVFADMIPAITCRRENMRAATQKGFATATDLADYLVRQGMPFRDAHEVVGKAVARCIEKGCDLADLDLSELQAFSDTIGPDVFDALTLEGSVAARNHIGGTAPQQVREAILRARQRIES